MRTQPLTRASGLKHFQIPLKSFHGTRLISSISLQFYVAWRVALSLLRKNRREARAMNFKLMSAFAVVTLVASFAVPSVFPPPPPLPPLPSVRALIVPVPPPPPRRAVVVRQPAPGYVWLDGYWDYRGSAWGWVAGHWGRPPAVSVRWIRPQYVKVDHGWRYVPAHWSHQRVISVNEGGHGHGKHKGWSKQKQVHHDRD